MVEFPEGAIAYPHKYVMSSMGPDTVADADRSRANWDLLRDEVLTTALGEHVGTA